MEHIEKQANKINNIEPIDIFAYGEDKINSSCTNKKSSKVNISCHNEFLNNPSITKFNENSQFIYDLDEGERYINSINNANKIKLNENEMNIFNKIYNEILKEKRDKEGKKEIFLNKTVLNDIHKYFIKLENIDDDLTLFLKNEYNNNYQRKGFTTRKLAEKYNLKTNKKVTHVTINNVLKRSLGLKYLKVAPKTNKIISENNALRIMTLIKIISRCLIQKISLIYIDESSIMNINNNFRTWIKPGDDIFCDIEKRKRYNLIMGINADGIIHYELLRDNVNEEIFIKFVENLKLEIIKKDIKYYALFLDNLSVHKSKNAIKYFCENKINIIYNVPYLSKFNSIELAFRGLKNILYKNVYENMESLKNDIYNILDSEKFKNSIRYNFKETISQYQKYYERYKDYNFNNIKNCY